MEKTRILLTGINGFIASNFARFLVKKGNVAVYGTVRRSSELHYIDDILNSIQLLTVDETYESVYNALSVSKPQIVFHLAALCINNHKPEQIAPLVNSNLTFGVHIAEASSYFKVQRIVNIGSISQHFNGEPYNPVNLYASLKKAYEDVLYYYAQTESFKVVNLHLPHCYGSGDMRPKVLNLLKNAALAGQETFAMSGGEQEMDILHISDIVSGIWRAAMIDTPDNACEFSLTVLNAITLKEIVERLISINGWDIQIKWGFYPYRFREALKYYKPDNTMPGWEPIVELDDGLKEFSGSWEE